MSEAISNGSAFVTQYFVVPLANQVTSGVQACQYYNANWDLVNKNDDNILDLSITTNFILISQPTPEQIAEHLKNSVIMAPNCQLFSACVHTLGQKLDKLPQIIPVSGGLGVIIPVAEKTKRGAVLIFQLSNETGQSLGLVATTDPQITNER